MRQIFLIFVLVILVPTLGLGQVIKDVPSVLTGDKGLISARGSFLFLFEYGTLGVDKDVNIENIRISTKESDHAAFVERAAFCYEESNRRVLKDLWKDMRYLSSHRWEIKTKEFNKKDYYESFSYATRTRAWSWIQNGFKRYHDQLLAYRLIKISRDLDRKAVPSEGIKRRDIVMRQVIEATVCSGAVVFMDAAEQTFVKGIFQRYHPDPEIWNIAVKSLERERLVQKTFSGGWFHDDAEKPLDAIAEQTVKLLRFIVEPSK